MRKSTLLDWKTTVRRVAMTKTLFQMKRGQKIKRRSGRMKRRGMKILVGVAKVD